ncbi:STAS domain-containing protein [Streptomyces sp. NBC_00388]|uniref:STAS domain-containing protein n=1 Tax=Streptomyces sp. NBC_00388 TaxID=2975735 RepID=UPI002E1B69C0
MHITTEIDGTTALITPHGEIDYDSLAALRATAAGLPQAVTDVTWDLHDARFMDVAGLHLLGDRRRQDRSPRRTAVTGLAPQPLRLLHLAAELFPAMELAARLPAPSPGRAA